MRGFALHAVFALAAVGLSVAIVGVMIDRRERKFSYAPVAPGWTEV